MKCTNKLKSNELFWYLFFTYSIAKKIKSDKRMGVKIASAPLSKYLYALPISDFNSK